MLSPGIATPTRTSKSWHAIRAPKAKIPLASHRPRCSASERCSSESVLTAKVPAIEDAIPIAANTRGRIVARMARSSRAITSPLIVEKDLAAKTPVPAAIVMAARIEPT